MADEETETEMETEPTEETETPKQKTRRRLSTGGDYRESFSDPLGAAGAKVDGIKLHKIKTREANSSELDVLSTLSDLRNSQQQIVELFVRLDDRMSRLESQTALINETRKYGDYIKLAIDRLGLHEISEDVRFKKPGSAEKAAQHFNALAMKIQADRNALNTTLFEGDVDKYNLLFGRFEAIAKQSGDESAIEFVELNRVKDNQHGMQYEIGDLSLMLNVLLCRQVGIAVPKAIINELRTSASKYGDVHEQYSI